MPPSSSPRRLVEEIARVFKEYGEERFSGRMARAVVERREIEPFTRTADLPLKC